MFDTAKLVTIQRALVDADLLVMERGFVGWIPRHDE